MADVFFSLGYFTSRWKEDKWLKNKQIVKNIHPLALTSLDKIIFNSHTLKYETSFNTTLKQTQTGSTSTTAT